MTPKESVNFALSGMLTSLNSPHYDSADFLARNERLQIAVKTFAPPEINISVLPPTESEPAIAETTAPPVVLPETAPAENVSFDRNA